MNKTLVIVTILGIFLLGVLSLAFAEEAPKPDACFTYEDSANEAVSFGLVNQASITKLNLFDKPEQIEKIKEWAMKEDNSPGIQLDALEVYSYTDRSLVQFLIYEKGCRLYLFTYPEPRFQQMKKFVLGIGA